MKKKIKHLLCSIELHNWDNKTWNIGDIRTCEWCGCTREILDNDQSIMGVEVQYGETKYPQKT